MESPRAKRQTQGETDRKHARRGRAQEGDGVEASVAVKLVSTVLREQHCDRERKPQPSMDQIQRSAWNSALGLELLVAVRCAVATEEERAAQVIPALEFTETTSTHA